MWLIVKAGEMTALTKAPTKRGSLTQFSLHRSIEERRQVPLPKTRKVPGGVYSFTYNDVMYWVGQRKVLKKQGVI